MRLKCKLRKSTRKFTSSRIGTNLVGLKLATQKKKTQRTEFASNLIQDYN